MHVRPRVLHSVANPGLSSKVHYVAKCHHIKQLLEQRPVVDIPFNDENPIAFQKLLAVALQAGIIIMVEIIEAQNPVAAAFKSDGHVGTDKTGSASDEDGEAVGGPLLRGAGNAFFPIGTAPGVVEGAAGRERRRRGREDVVEEDEDEEEGGPEGELGEGGVEAETVDVRLRFLQLEFSGGGGDVIKVGNCWL